MHVGRTASLVVLAVCLSACNAFKVKTDYDQTADFSSFRSFAFAGPAVEDRRLI